jgi:hypothetical protein
VKAYETVYLLKWLFPETQVQKFRQSIAKSRSALFSQFNQNFVSTAAESSSYWDKFEIVDDDDYDSEEDAVMHYEEHSVPPREIADDDMINQPIEDIDSDAEEEYLPA